MVTLMRNMTEWGVSPEASPYQVQHLRVTNVVLLISLIGSILQTIVLFATGAIDSALINMTAPFVFGGGLLLMKRGYTTAARVMVITIAFIASYAMIATLGRDANFQMILVFGGAFSLAVFSLEERLWLIYGMIAPLICFALLEYNDYQPILGMARAQFTESELTLVRFISIFLVWSSMSIHFVYFSASRRRSQEQLVSSAKMVAMGRMAAGIAHEINNPLQRIVSHAERLKVVVRKPETSIELVDSHADSIQNVAMRIADIVKGLLSLSRDSSRDPIREVALQHVVAGSLDYCRARLESQKIELTIGEIPENWTVLGREAQLSEVILNVLNNAYDAVSETPEKCVSFKIVGDERYIDIVIEDSGPGVDEKVMNRIFDPFFTTKPVGKGTGLGLSICRAIMSAHGGSIFCEPVVQGAKFVVRIPRGANLKASVRFQDLEAQLADSQSSVQTQAYL